MAHAQFDFYIADYLARMEVVRRYDATGPLSADSQDNRDWCAAYAQQQLSNAIAFAADPEADARITASLSAPEEECFFA